MLIILFIITITISLITAAVSGYNLFSRPVLRYLPRNNSSWKPLVSVLIPARNEAENIGRALYTITQQTYRNIEIIVLDDHSDDRTAEIVRKVANIEPRLRLIKGKPLPDGWTGKNWACHQLAREANGEQLLFVDADVQLAPEAISSGLARIEQNKLDMLSVFPTQIMQSLSERLVVPMMNWILLSFLPLRFVSDSPNPKFVAANGQFILLSREIYSVIGGHDAVKGKIVEDMELARKIKNNGNKIMTLLGGELISCRMYDNLVDAANGFTKNFYAGFNIPQWLFILFIAVLAVVYLVPFIAVLENGLFIYPITLIILNRLFISIISQQAPLYNIILHPFQILLMLIIGIRSVETYSKGQIVWKGRRI